MKRTTIIALVLAATWISSLMAANFPPRNQLAERSASSGVGKPELALLRVNPGPGRDAALDALKERFATAAEKVTTTGNTRKETMTKATVLHGQGWILEVAADGKKARYRNFGYLEGSTNKGVAVSQRPKQETLETKGRQFITERLRDVVKLGPGEELVAMFAEYAIGGGGPTAGGNPIAETVTAANVIYGRTIDGVHVIGPGSKVAILFGSDGSIAGFDFDWPDYQRSEKKQRVASMAEVKRRMTQLGGINVDRSPANVERVECGYFDLGSGRRDASAPLQAACAFFTVEKKIVDAEAHAADPASGHIVDARIEVIPAGQPIESDPKWPQAERLQGRTVKNLAPPQSGPKAPAP